MTTEEKHNFYTVRGYQLLGKDWGEGLSPSLEDYLEMICRALEEQGEARINRLAHDLNVKPSSASKMVARLAEKGFVDYQKYGEIQLTEKGRRHGGYLLWRHQVIDDFFRLIFGGVENDATAEGFMEAELVEHDLRPQTVVNLARLCRFFAENPAIYEAFKQC